jgi:hypothetical protein
MAAAERTRQSKEAAVAKAADLRGRVDAIDGTRIFGWAWNAAEPTQRLNICIFAGTDIIATVVADKTRVDLRRNGSGDGGHAFDVELPAEATGGTAPIRVEAVHPEGGANLELEVPTEHQRAAEAAFAAPLAPILDRLEATVQSQRRIQLGQVRSLREMTTAARLLADIVQSDGGLRSAVQEVRAAQADMAERLAAVDVFLVRFDGVIGAFHERLEALARHEKHGVRGHLLLLAGVVGALCGIALMAAMRL